MLVGVLVLLMLQVSNASSDVGPLVRALWLLQSYGVSDASIPSNDQKLKATLAKAISKDGAIELAELGGMMAADTFDKLSRGDRTIDKEDIARALELSVPDSRKELLGKISAHADFLTTSFDMIDESHRKAGLKLVQWIVANYKPDLPLHITIVCTGNSRRSIIGSSMGNIASAYYGMPNIRFHSGGTTPSAFNSRTVHSLRDIGFEIEATGAEAERGDPKTANPIYRVVWGKNLETLEFSKHYADSSNPQSGFAALMVCNEADSECPAVTGASLRISLPYQDPKIYDDGQYETAKYAERRDDIGRFMLSVMAHARREIEAKK